MYGRADLANSSYLVGYVEASMASEDGVVTLPAISEGMNDVESLHLILGVLLSDDMENGKLLCESCIVML